MALGVENAFEFDHVVVLFRVNVVVGEVDRYIFDLELHFQRQSPPLLAAANGGKRRKKGLFLQYRHRCSPVQLEGGVEWAYLYRVRRRRFRHS